MEPIPIFKEPDTIQLSNKKSYKPHGSAADDTQRLATHLPSDCSPIMEWVYDTSTLLKYTFERARRFRDDMVRTYRYTYGIYLQCSNIIISVRVIITIIYVGRKDASARWS